MVADITQQELSFFYVLFLILGRHKRVDRAFLFFFTKNTSDLIFLFIFTTGRGEAAKVGVLHMEDSPETEYICTVFSLTA